MKIEIDDTPEYVVLTPNPEFTPQMNVYEIERGAFSTLALAQTLAREIMEVEQVSVQISKRQWQLTMVDKLWMNHEHA